MKPTTIKSLRGDGLDDSTAERPANVAPTLLHEIDSQLRERAALDLYKRHESTLMRRLERRRTVVRWLLKYPPIALQGARQPTEHRGSLDDAPCPSS